MYTVISPCVFSFLLLSSLCFPFLFVFSLPSRISWILSLSFSSPFSLPLYFYHFRVISVLSEHSSRAHSARMWIRFFVLIGKGSYSGSKYYYFLFFIYLICFASSFFYFHLITLLYFYFYFPDLIVTVTKKEQPPLTLIIIFTWIRPSVRTDQAVRVCTD